MLKKIIQFLFAVFVLSLVLSPAWAATSVDQDSKPLAAVSLRSPDSDGSDLQADLLKGRFVIAKGGGGGGGCDGGGAGGGNADCDGSGPNGISGSGSGEKAGPQIQSRQHYRHQHRRHYSELLPKQAYYGYGPGEGLGYDGEGPKDGSGYGAPEVR